MSTTTSVTTPVKDPTRVIPVIAEIKPPVKKIRAKTKNKKCDIHRCTEYQHEIDDLWERWRDIHNNGNHHDPFNTDGFNLNNIRNKIEHYKSELQKNGFGSDCCNYCDYRKDNTPISIPPKSDKNYIANPNTIRKNAREALKMYEKDKNLQFLLHVFGLSKKEQKLTGYCETVGIYHKLEHAIKTDNLVEMRFKSNVKKYQNEFKECANKIRKLGKLLVQKTLF